MLKNTKRLRQIISILLILFADVFIIYLSLFFAYLTRKYLPFIFDIPQFGYVFKNNLYFIYISLVFISIFIYERLYTLHLTFWDETKLILKAVTLGMLFSLTLLTLSKSSSDVSRLTMIIAWCYIVILLPSARHYTKTYLHKIGLYVTNLIIVSDDETEAKEVKCAIEQEHNLGYLVQDILLIKTSIAKEQVAYIKSKKTSGIIVVTQNSALREDTINSLQHIVRKIFFLPSAKNIAFLNSKIEYLFNSQMFLIKLDNNLNKLTSKLLKRAFDIFLTLLILPILLPILAIIAIFIKISTKESPFFIQERLGQNNTLFKCIKFQTMHPNSDKLLDDFFKLNPKEAQHWNEFKKIKGDDPRVTKIGNFLRKTSLDELPQIFNVLNSTMSFVGPRPYLEREICDMQDRDETIRIAKPGITGMWQVMGRNNLSFEKRTQLDEWYIRNWSLWLDIVLLFKTVNVVLKRGGAY